MNGGQHERLAYSNWSLQPLASNPVAIASRSISFSSARTARPTAARLLACSLASVVDRPCFQCNALSRARPSGVFAPVDFPPCIRHRRLPLTAGFLQGVPLRVRAPQRVPGQSGPNCQCRAASSNVMSMYQPPLPKSSKVRGANTTAHAPHLPALDPRTEARGPRIKTTGRRGVGLALRGPRSFLGKRAATTLNAPAFPTTPPTQRG